MGNNGLFGLLILVVPIILLVMFFSKRKKNNEETNGFDGTPKKAKKDEVWRTLKQYLIDNNERGKEIIYSFVAKRPNPMQEKKIRKAYKEETDNYIKSHNLTKKEIKKYKKERIKEASREKYCIYFVTRDSKTRVKDKPRIIEAEVVQKLTNNKKEPTKRSIIINGLQNFDIEYKWIEPIKKREDDKIARFEKQKQAKITKKELKKQKKQKHNLNKKSMKKHSNENNKTN